MSPQNYIHSTATIGDGTRVWHFSVILADVKIGSFCSVGSCCEIGHGSIIGDGTRIGFGTFLPPASWVGSNVFIGPGVTCCDDRSPRVNNPGYTAEPPVIEDGASIGAGAVLLPGVRIGAGAMVGAGAIVTKDVPPATMVRGEPARVRERVRSGE
jgi:acetyltransferase-like isoleucine patch superfamily enzyme